MGTLRRALILAPMNSELRPIVRYARARESGADDLALYRGRAGDVEVAVVQLGVGPASARSVTERALRHFSADHVLVSGIAGGMHPRLAIGTVVVPEEIMDVASGRRYQASPMEGVELRGIVATTDHLMVDPGRLADLQDLGVLAVDMESSGVAGACETAGVPWTTFRVVSDRPDEGLADEAVMALLRPDGTADVAAALRLMVRHPSRIPGLVRLARDSSMAASKSARAALGALGWRP